MRTERRSGEAVGGLFIVAASFQFGIVVVLGKILTKRPHGLDVPTMLAVRFAFGAVLLVAALVALGRPVLPVPRERVPLALLAMFGYAVEASFFFLAATHGEAAAVTLLFFTYPILVTVGSMALGQGAPGWMIGASLLCALAGAALVILASGGLAVTGLGVLFALGAATVYSGYLLGADRVLRGTDALAGAMWVSLFASLALAVFALASGHAEVPRGLRQWGPLFGMGAATAGAFVCLFAGLRRLGPVRTAIVAATEPLSATVLAFLFLDEPIRAGVVGGGVLILAGAVTASLARAASSSEPEIP